MAGLEIRKFGWFRRQPLWKENQAWRQHRTAMRQSFEAVNSAAGNALAAAQNNLGSGLAELAAQASIGRTQSEIAAKKGQIDKLA